MGATSATAYSGAAGRVQVFTFGVLATDPLRQFSVGDTAATPGTVIARLTQWTFTATCGESSWGDSDCAGYTNRMPTRRDGSGSMAGKLDSDSKIYSLFMPGDAVTLYLNQNASAAPGGAGKTASWKIDRAIITNFSLSFDQDTREVVGWTADFSCDGQYQRPGDWS